MKRTALFLLLALSAVSACGDSAGDSTTGDLTGVVDTETTATTETDAGPTGSVGADGDTNGDTAETDSTAATDLIDASATDVRFSPTVARVCVSDEECLSEPGTARTVCDVRRPDGVAMCYERCPLPNCFNPARPYCNLSTGKCSTDPLVEEGVNCGRLSICGRGCEMYQCDVAVGCPSYGNANNCALLAVETAVCGVCLTDCLDDSDCLDADKSRCIGSSGRCVTVDEHQRHYKYGKYR
jgi:hypothetical protein